MMANGMMSLRTPLEKSADAELLRDMVGCAAQRLMGLEVEGLSGAAHRDPVGETRTRESSPRAEGPRIKPVG